MRSITPVHHEVLHATLLQYYRFNVVVIINSLFLLDSELKMVLK